MQKKEGAEIPLPLKFGFALPDYMSKGSMPRTG